MSAAASLTRHVLAARLGLAKSDLAKGNFARGYGAASLAGQGPVDRGEVRFAIGRHEDVGGVDVRMRAVVVVLVHEPAAPPSILAPVRAPAGKRLEQHFPRAQVRAPDVAGAAVRALHGFTPCGAGRPVVCLAHGAFH